MAKAEVTYSCARCGEMKAPQMVGLCKPCDRIVALEVALMHIADNESTRDCCKFAALNGYRRRHLKEVAYNALKNR